MYPSIKISVRLLRATAVTALILFCSSNCARTQNASPNPVTVGDARFTIITPNCIRLEYSATGKFVDQPSTFAFNRNALYNGFTLHQSEGSTIIDTGSIRLTYTPDGNPFSPKNMQAQIKKDSGFALWAPGDPNPGNLGGTARTLDGAAGPIDLGQGLISRDGWYLLDDSTSPLLTNNWVQSRPSDAGTDWYLFGYGSDYRAALASLTAVSGPVPMPRKYALGAWYSRYWPYSSGDYRQIVQEYSEHDFPLDNIVMDMDWHKDGWTGWSWNRTLLPDAEQLLAWFHSQGLHVTLNLHPADGVGPQEDQYGTFMRDMGADPAMRRTIPFDAADKRYMDALFSDVIQPLETEGVDFWWLDWQQYPNTRSVPDLTNLFWLNTLLYQDTGSGDKRGLSFSRWAGWGDQRHPIHFSGDADTGFPMLAFEVPFTSTAGNVGCFFWSHDIGGHVGPRNEESYTRWVQFGATSPVLRSHSMRNPETDRRPWKYSKWAENSMRISFHLRSRLFPYIYTAAAQACRDSVPLDRPLYIDYPHEEKSYHNGQEYLVGDNLLAAPVVEAGTGPGRVGSQSVWFPPAADTDGATGAWYNVFTGERFRGNSDALVTADIDEFPLYARGGTPIPMQPYTPHMGTALLTTLVVRCYPGDDNQTGKSTLYEDDGVSKGYQRGEFETTPLVYSRSGDTITVTVGPSTGSFEGQSLRRSIVLELPDTQKERSLRCSVRAATTSYDASKQMNVIWLPASTIKNAVRIVVQAPVSNFAALSASAALRRASGILGHPVKDVNAALTEPGLPPAGQTALLATLGIGLVAHNDGSYFYGGAVHNIFYAPKGCPDHNQVTFAPQNQTEKTSGLPLNASTTDTYRRGVLVHKPVQAIFSLGSKTFRLPVEITPLSELLGPEDLAATSRVTASGSEQGYSPEGAVDGIVGGYPGNGSQEWSAGQTIGAWLRLDWDAPQNVSRVELYDRPNTTDQVTAGTIEFSDGSVLPVGPLPNDAKQGLQLRFPSKSITWLRFTVTAVKPGTQNAGLSEIGVFGGR